MAESYESVYEGPRRTPIRDEKSLLQPWEDDADSFEEIV
jgi:hypothetical protein